MPDLDTPEIDEASGGELALDTAPAPPPSTVASPGFEKYLSALGLTKPDTTRSDALLLRDLQLGQERRAGLETMAARRRTEAADMGRTADTMAAERAAAKPAPLTLPEAPKPQPRAFAEPAPDASLLSQLHAVVLGAGQIAQQMAALKGANILGMTAIKGAMEGWQAGDTERANREIQTWQRSVEKLLAEHNDRTAAYKRLLEDHSLTWNQRFSLSRLQAEADQFQDMAVASEQQDIGKLLQATMRSEQAGATLQQNFGKVLLQLKQREAELDEKRRETDLRNKQFELQLAQTAFDRAESRDQKEREGQRMEALRREIANLQAATSRENAAMRDATQRELGAMRIEAARAAKLLSPQYQRLTEKEFALSESLQTVDVLEKAVKLVSDQGVIPKADTYLEKKNAQVRQQTALGREDISTALNTIKREGGPLLLGRELYLGLTPGVARLSRVADMEIGDIAMIPKAYWDQVIPRMRRTFGGQLDLTRQRLSEFRGEGPPGGAAPAGAADKSDPLGIRR